MNTNVDTNPANVFGGNNDFCHKMLLKLQAGDMVIWDSRTLHCSISGFEPPTTPIDRYLRVASYSKWRNYRDGI